MAFINFDVNDFQEVNTDFSPIEPGQYLAELTSSSTSPTQSGGTKLELEFTITEGQYARRKVWENLNIINNSATAQNIARTQLKQLIDACGLTAGQNFDSSQMHNIPVTIHVSQRKGTGNYEGKIFNEIKKFESAGGVPQLGNVPNQGGYPTAQVGNGMMSPSEPQRVVNGQPAWTRNNG